MAICEKTNLLFDQCRDCIAMRDRILEEVMSFATIFGTEPERVFAAVGAWLDHRWGKESPEQEGSWATAIADAQIEIETAKRRIAVLQLSIQTFRSLTKRNAAYPGGTLTIKVKARGKRIE